MEEKSLEFQPLAVKSFIEFNPPETWKFFNPGGEALTEHWGKIRRNRLKAIEAAKKAGAVSRLEDQEPVIFVCEFEGRPLYFFPFGGSYCISRSLIQIRRYRRQPGLIRW